MQQVQAKNLIARSASATSQAQIIDMKTWTLRNCPGPSPHPVKKSPCNSKSVGQYFRLQDFDCWALQQNPLRLLVGGRKSEILILIGAATFGRIGDVYARCLLMTPHDTFRTSHEPNLSQNLHPVVAYKYIYVYIYICINFCRQLGCQCQMPLDDPTRSNLNQP